MYKRLQYISQGQSADDHYTHIREALDAGCRWIQLRFKNASATELESLAQRVKQVCDTYQAELIINDHPHLAASIGAKGLHLGLEDMPISEARSIVGPETVIGGTANTLEHVLQRIAEGCNYVGLGPFRFTSTKEKLSPILGLEGYTRIMNELKQRNLHIPVYAIGGITPEDVEAIMMTGVHGIAVSGIITHAADKGSLVEHLNTILDGSPAHSR